MELSMKTRDTAKRTAAALAEMFGLNGLGLAVQRRFLHPCIRVVNYHDVFPSLLNQFELQLASLKRRFVPASRNDLAKLLRDGVWPHSRPGLIPTFDDGLRSHSEVVAPVLDRMGFQGWFFVPINLVLADPAQQPGEAARRGVLHACDTDRDPRIFLSIGELRQLSQRHIIGCHTANHVRLTNQLTEAELDREVLGAKVQLETVVGRAIDSFAWVGGDECAYSRGAAERIAGAFTYSFTTNTRITQPQTSCLQIDRTHLEADFSDPLTHFQISGLMDLYYAPKRRRLNACLTQFTAGSSPIAQGRRNR